MINEWLKEGELSLKPIQINSPSSSLHCCIKNQETDVLYNPTIRANLILDEFLLAFIGDQILTLTERKLKRPVGSHMSSYGVIKNVSLRHDDIKVVLDFHVFEDLNFDFLIGYPIKAHLKNVPDSGTLNIKIRKESHFVPITRSSSHATKKFPAIEPLEEVLAVSVFDSPESALERDAKYFDEREDIEDETLELPMFKKPSQPPVELKPLPSGLRYAFLNSDVESPMIISDKLSEEDPTKLITILEKH